MCTLADIKKWIQNHAVRKLRTPASIDNPPLKIVPNIKLNNNNINIINNIIDNILNIK